MLHASPMSTPVAAQRTTETANVPHAGCRARCPLMARCCHLGPPRPRGRVPPPRGGCPPAGAVLAPGPAPTKGAGATSAGRMPSRWGGACTPARSTCEPGRSGPAEVLRLPQRRRRPRMKKILVGTDTSGSADLAVETAADLAASYDAELLVLYVRSNGAVGDAADPKKAADPKGYLERMTTRFPSLKVRSWAESGDPAERLVEVAAAERDRTLSGLRFPRAGTRGRPSPGGAPRARRRARACGTAS